MFDAMTRAGHGVVAFLASAVWLLAPTARAIELRDGTDFSVTTAGQPPCIVFPAALYDRSACPPGAHPMRESPAAPPITVLAVGSLPIGGPDGDERVILGATRVTSDDNSRPGDLAAFARGMADEMVQSRDGARLVGKPSASLVDVGGQSVARVSFDMDEYLGGGRAHDVAYVAWSKAGTYGLSFVGLTSSAAAIDALAAQTAQTIHVARPAPAAPSRDYKLGYATGKLMGTLIVPIAVAVAAALMFRRKRRDPGAPSA
jgi:hypothetical protein